MNRFLFFFHETQLPENWDLNAISSSLIKWSEKLLKVALYDINKKVLVSSDLPYTISVLIVIFFLWQMSDITIPWNKGGWQPGMD